MSIESDIAAIFADNGWTWSIKGQGHVVPTEDDVLAALDEAARILYHESIGAQLQVGRLIIIKKTRGFDVYVLAGSYE